MTLQYVVFGRPPLPHSFPLRALTSRLVRPSVLPLTVTRGPVAITPAPLDRANEEASVSVRVSSPIAILLDLSYD